jgi:cytoplasmic tRNA 2-thiolation protein 2
MCTLLAHMINTKNRNCFIPFIIYKFRRALEPSVNPNSQRRNVLKPSGNLLIGFSGGLGSTVLLDLVHRCYYSEEGKLSNEEKGGKDAPRNNVWPKVFVCYVEVSEAYPEVSVILSGSAQLKNQMRNRSAEVNGVMKAYPEFEFIPLRLSHAFDHEWWNK